MGLLQRETEELRALDRQFMANKVDASHVNTRIGIFNQVMKRSQLTFQALALTAKYGAKVKHRLEKMNMLDYEQAVSLLADPETEKLKCPIEDEPITREACLDFSGSHPEDCNGCENKAITQNKLLGEKP